MQQEEQRHQQEQPQTLCDRDYSINIYVGGASRNFAPSGSSSDRMHHGARVPTTRATST
jgi:hypothetical protein